MVTARGIVAASALALLLVGQPPVVAEEGLPPPVVLLHGWHAAGDHDSLADSSLALLGSRLTADGWTVYWATGVALDPADTMFDSARTLATFLADVAARHPAQPIRLIGHSYGGLVARALLETAIYDDLQAAGVRVSHLVALGTPMGGIDLWLPLLFVLGDPLGEPSVWELTPAFMEQFNDDHHPPDGTHYVVVAGDARRQVPPLWLLPASDGAVTVASAHALVNGRYGLVERLTGDLHTTTDYTRRLGWRSLVDDERTWREVIRIALRSPDPTTPLADGIATAGATAVRAGTLTHTPVEVVTVPPGTARTVTVPPGPASSLLVATDGDPALSVRRLGRNAATGPSAGSGDSVGDGGSLVTVAALPLGNGYVTPLDPGGVTLQLHNRGTTAARVAWMGLLSPGTPGLRLAVDSVDGHLAIALGGAAGPASEGTADVLDAHGWRHLMLHEQGLGAATDSATGDRLSGTSPAVPGYVFVRARARVGGQILETETTARLGPPASLAR